MIKRNLIAMVIIFFTNSINAQLTNANFKDAIKDCLSTNPVDGLCTYSKYGSMPVWDVSNVTDMSNAFENKKSFNGDISEWDVSNVNNMTAMFYDAHSFNQSLNKWKVSKVTDMFIMFYGASSFNGDISGWDVSNVTDMSMMFYEATSFNQDLSSWDVSNVTDMYKMFNFSNLSTSNYDSTLIGWSEQIVQPGVELEAQGIHYCNASAARETLIDKGWKISDGGQKCPITNATFKDAIKDCLSTNPVDGLCTSSKHGSMPDWDVSNVTDMSYAFDYRARFNGDISKWNVSNVTDMSCMFCVAVNFNGDISEWDVGNVTDMVSMFAVAENFNGDISEWDVGNVTDMSGMFYYGKKFNGDISKWNVSNVTDMSSMFCVAENFNGFIGEWDVIKVENMKDMFMFAKNFNRDISEWDVGNVTNMSRMFYEAKYFDQSLNNWNVRNVINMFGMFYRARYFNQDLNDWNVSNVTYMSKMFWGAESFNQSLNNWNVRNVTSMDKMFNSSNLSTSNYDSTLIGWSKQTVQPGVRLGAEGIHHCDGWFAKFKLEAYFNWTITDAGFTNYCFFDSNHDQNKTMSVDDPKNQLDISIYPNPTSEMVYIEGNYTQLKVVVYDLLGKQLINKSITNHIDLSHLEKGIYLLQFSDGMKLSTQKIVKN